MVAFQQLKVYVRAGLMLVVAAAVVLVFVFNRHHRVPVWFFGLTDVEKPINVVWLMLCTAVATLVVWWTASLAWGLIRDMREAKRRRTIDAANRLIHERAVELDERERRIDSKLRQAIGEDSEATDSRDSNDADA